MLTLNPFPVQTKTAPANPYKAGKMPQAVSIVGKPTAGDRVHFSGSSNPEIAAEEKRLKEDLPPAQLQLKPETIRARAEYNVTKNRDCLNQFTLYRKQYTAQKDEANLKKYDQLVDKLMDKAEFRYVENGQMFRDKAFSLYPKNCPYIPVITPIYRAIKRFVLSLFIKFSRPFTKSFFNRLAERQKKRGAKIPEDKVQALVKDKTRPVTDESTKYLIASGIAELLHQHPEYIDQALKHNSKHPLRFVLSDKGYKGGVLAGQDYMGLNMLWLWKPAIWKEAEVLGKQASQHEFIHLLSEGSDMDVLPIMSKAQQAQLRQLRQNMEKEYMQKDYGFTNRWRLNAPTSTGLRQYAFKDDLEFLAESIDTFKLAPEKLRQTEAGKDLYTLYKDLFDIDPLNEIPEADRKNADKTGSLLNL